MQTDEEVLAGIERVKMMPMNENKRVKVIQLLEAEHAFEKAVQVKARDSLFVFNRFVLNVEEGKQQMGDFHKQLCKFVQDDRKKKKLILMPRGHLKSTLITIGYSLHQIINNPNIRILILNATWQMAVDFLTEIKRHLQNNETLINLYGDLTQGNTEWSQDRITLSRSNQNIKGPTVWASGVESNLVGSHPDLIIMDDLVNRDNIETRESIEKVILRYKDALDLLEPGGQLIVIGTRWTEGELYSWLMDKDSGASIQYDVMIKKAYEGDLMTGEGFQSLWPEKFTREELLERLKGKGWYEFCTPYETPILMSDFTTKPIGEVKPGDEIIGFERQGDERTVLIKTIVKNKSSLLAPVNILSMESGRTVRCTRQHKWYTARGRTDKTHSQYASAKIGRDLMFVCPVEEKIWSQEQKDAWQYLAGMFDGEGSAKSGGCLTISQGFKNKVVIDKIKNTLNILNIEYSEYVKKADSSKRQPNDILMIWLKDNFQTQIDLIRYGDPAKKYQIADKMIRKGKRFIKERDKVLDIIEEGMEEVFALETGTGNYIAWGYASSNSAQYLNNPVPDESATFKKGWFQRFDIEDIRGKEMTKVLTIDPAISLDKEADYTAMVVSGIDVFGNIFILDIVRGHYTPNQIINKIFELNSMWSPKEIGIETVAFQKALAYTLREEMKNTHKMVPIRELKTQDRSKDQRIKGLQPSYENGKIFHRNGHPLTVYLEDELMKFPRGRNDDIIDAESYMLDLLFPPRQKTHRYHNQYLY
jgi:predicted phage terminase large subunit-like protein